MTLKLTEPAVLLEGGPRHGWAYHEREMDEIVRTHVYNGQPFPYRRTERFVVHPRAGGKVTSRVWEYIPRDLDRDDAPPDDPWAEL